MLSLNELLFDFFQDFEITNWRLLSENKKSDFDIAIVEGAATTKEHVGLLKEIRETSKIVVAIGACAISGNIFAELSPEKRKKMAAKIYDKNYKLKAEFLEPIEKFIKVDEKIPGCPANIELFKKFLEKIRDKKISSKIKDVSLPDFTAKIEGHGILKINFKEKKAEFEIEESERLVEGLLLGKNFNMAPFITSRICGICPTAHNICSLLSLENALKINISKETQILRRLLLTAQIIKSHVLHLFFLVLPDYAGMKSGINLSKKYPAEFHLMLNLKRVADQILKVIGGTSAFPTNTMIGGFKKPPKASDLFVLKTSIHEVIDEAQDLVRLFSELEIPELRVNVKLANICPPDNSYPLYPGNLPQPIKSIMKKNSPAKLGVLKNGGVIKVGALARLSSSSEKLYPKAKILFQKFQPNLRNPFNNNLAQAIEVLHLLEEIDYLIEKELKNKNLEKSKGIEKEILPAKTVTGRACLEAPRGILTHRVKINPQGKIADYHIIAPTQINLASLEKEMQELIKKSENLSLKKQKREIEKLIRAFDPCITCAVH